MKSIFVEEPWRFGLVVLWVVFIVGSVAYQAHGKKTCQHLWSRVENPNFARRFVDTVATNIKDGILQSYTACTDPSMRFWFIKVWVGECCLLLSISLLSGFGKPNLPEYGAFGQGQITRGWIYLFLEAFIMPGCFEEFLFRVLPLRNTYSKLCEGFQLLQQSDTGNAPMYHVRPRWWTASEWSWSAVAILVYVFCYHLDSIHAQHCLYDRLWFLFLATSLGMFATLIYHRTGSLLFATLSHGLPVAVWMNFLSGLRGVAIAQVDLMCNAPYTAGCHSYFDWTLHEFNTFLNETGQGWRETFRCCPAGVSCKTR